MEFKEEAFVPQLLKRLFGTLSRKISPQKIKDEIRAGWEDEDVPNVEYVK